MQMSFQVSKKLGPDVTIGRRTRRAHCRTYDPAEGHYLNSSIQEPFVAKAAGAG